MSCVSARFCTAVGLQSASSALIETLERHHLDHRAQPARGSPSASDSLDSVTCAAVRACTAVGSRNKVDGTLTNVLFRVSCPSAAICMAVGNADGNSRRQTLTELGTSAGHGGTGRKTPLRFSGP